MSDIKSTCTECGVNVDLPSPAVRVISTPRTLAMSFRCPECDGQSYNSVTSEGYRLLRAAGVAFVVLLPHTVPPGPRITEDDLLAFGLALEATPCPAGAE